MTTTRENWEQEFDRIFSDNQNPKPHWAWRIRQEGIRDELKKFFRTLITAERQEAAREERERIRGLVTKSRDMFFKKDEAMDIDKIRKIRQQLRKEILSDIDALIHDGKEDA